MAIPSYDDLTPSIPDVTPGEVFTSARRLLLSRLGVWSPRPGSQSEDPALESRVSVRHPGLQTPVISTPPCTMPMGATERLMAIARDFSPRIERHPGGTVVLDVSGLQRLLGDAAIDRRASRACRRAAGRHRRRRRPRRSCWRARRPGVTVAAGDPEVALRTVPLAILQQLAAEIDAASRRCAARPADRVRPAADRHAHRGRSTSCSGGG